MRKYIIAIDLGGTNLKAALIDSKLKIIRKEAFSTKRFAKKGELLQAIVDAVDSLILKFQLKKSQILGVGLGLPGPIDVDKGLVHFLPNIPGWKHVKLRYILQKRIQCKVSLDNDANLMSLAEHRLGAAKGSRNAICLTLGTGVGSGVIIEGVLYRGSSYAAGELGHMPLNFDGPRCSCKGIACLEKYIGNAEIQKQAEAVFKRKITLEELSSLAREGNSRAIGIWRKIGEYLGVGLTQVVNLLNPDCIVIGGGVSAAGKILFDSVKRTVRQRAMSVQARAVRIKRSLLGSDAGLIGAAILVKEGLGK
ncbi:MAG: ROK family protein [Candidatus Omnitrophota bacterium]